MFIHIPDIIIVDIVGASRTVKTVEKGLDFFACATAAACSFNATAHNGCDAWVATEVVGYPFPAEWLHVAIRVQNERGHLTRARMRWGISTFIF